MDIFGIRKLARFDTSDPKNIGLIYTNLGSFPATDVKSKKVIETNPELLNAEAISEEAINRDLGFQDVILKNGIYSSGVSSNELPSLILAQTDLKTGKDVVKPRMLELFKDEYIRCLNRGYTQRQSRKMAKAVVDKFIEEEKNYYIKKWSI